MTFRDDPEFHADVALMSAAFGHFVMCKRGYVLTPEDGVAEKDVGRIRYEPGCRLVWPDCDCGLDEAVVRAGTHAATRLGLLAPPALKGAAGGA